jgi:DNA repair exonuclease SbcCD nuclease subunit
MKILHCADIHLGSKMEAKLPKDKMEERRIEVRSSFNRMVNYAKDNGINVIMLSGDVFDSDRPLKKDKEFFYSVVKNNPQIDFLYLRGNHDSMQSYTESDIANLKTFSTEWTTYQYGDVAISGIEIVKDNASSLYSTLKLNPAQKNIVMLHGQYGDVSGVDKINIPKLRNKGIDYLALGHLHTHQYSKFDERGVYVYSGCLEGRGFDEDGEKGFVIVDTDDFSYTFVKNSYRIIYIIEADISASTDAYTAYNIVKGLIKCGTNDILRIVLKGEIGYDSDGLATELEKQLSEYYFVSVKDETLRKFNVEEIAGDLSLKGEFIRTVLANNDYTNEQKQQIISIGLKALSGREVD